MKEIKCPSGAVLKITPSSFATAKALYQAVLKEVKSVDVSSSTDVRGLCKDLFCLAFSSDEVEKCLKECFKRCTYDSGKGDLKIDDSTFESVESREDYMTVCIEIAKENVFPFVKSLYAEYQRILAMIPENPA